MAYKVTTIVALLASFRVSFLILPGQYFSKRRGVQSAVARKEDCPAASLPVPVSAGNDGRTVRRTRGRGGLSPERTGLKGFAGGAGRGLSIRNLNPGKCFNPSASAHKSLKIRATVAEGFDFQTIQTLQPRPFLFGLTVISPPPAMPARQSLRLKSQSQGLKIQSQGLKSPSAELFDETAAF